MAPVARPESKQTAGPPEEPRGPYAAVDLGTNNCRLLVAKPSPKGFRVVEAYSRICRLGEGLEASGRLSETAMARTLEALEACAQRIRRRRVARARAVATAACRAADNCEGFVERVRARTGLELEIISSEEEAQLALTGCAPLLTRARSRAIVFDIGGGSTEVTWIALEPASGGPAPGGPAPGGPALDGLKILASVSLPLGVVTFAERFGGHRIKAETYRAMVAEVRAAFAPFEAAHGLGAAVAAGQVQMLGTSGTVTTLAGVHRGLKRYDRRRVDGCRLDRDEVRATVRRIRSMGYEERVGHPCIGEQRADLVVAGCAILEGLCTLWPVDGLRVADRGLREGILYHLMNGAAVAGWDGRQG